MSAHDHRPPESAYDDVDTANFQQFMDDQSTGAVNDGRAFRLLSLLVGVIVLVGVMYLLLF